MFLPIIILMSFRIDPVDEKGVFDHDYYSSPEYSSHVKILKQYLKDEGFESKTERFSISFLNREWVCAPIVNKKKNK